MDDFFDGASAMRAAFEAHFETPHLNGERHQVWDYWFVPGIYTYLRTLPGNVFEAQLVNAFVHQLRHFALSQLGLSHCSMPYLSLYVDGCVQGMHNDAAAGSLAYVHSLTPWATRRFEGGETQVFHAVDYWREGRYLRPGAGTSFSDLVPAAFNRLLLFDDRLLHSVPEVHGTMDPRQGRVVLHGHLSAGGLLLQGGAGQAAMPALQALRDALDLLVTDGPDTHTGVLTLSCPVAPDGAIGDARVLLDRVLDAEGRPALWPALVPALDLLAQAKLPAAETAGTLTVPLVLVPDA